MQEFHLCNYDGATKYLMGFNIQGAIERIFSFVHNKKDECVSFEKSDFLSGNMNPFHLLSRRLHTFCVLNEKSILTLMSSYNTALTLAYFQVLPLSE